MKTSLPKQGRFGDYGGRYIPETLVPAIEELEENYLKFKDDKNFKKELDYYLKYYAGRPTPLYFAKNLTEKIGGAKIYLKREDLLHGGAHKINNTLGKALLAKKMKKQMKKINNKTPDAVVACVGGGSNAIGTFYPLLDSDTEMIGVEAAGLGLKTDKHSATLSAGSKGVLHGMMTYLLQDKEGQIRETHSISAGLDYPGVGPEHSYLKDTGRVKYHSATDKEVIDAFLLLTRTEGIIPALESAHAIADVIKLAKKRPKSESIVVTLSGRGDKDVEIVEEYMKKHVKN